MRVIAWLLAGLLISGLTLPGNAVERDSNGVARQERNKETQALYATLSTLTLSERKTLYRVMSAETKSALWIEHLRTFAEANNLTEAQQQIVRDAIALATPRLFSISPETAGWKDEVVPQITALEQRARLAFTLDQAKAAFARLGPDDPTVVLRDAALMSAAAYSRPSKVAPTYVIKECDCTLESDWCIGTCKGGICTHTQGGCGWWWLYDCIMLCDGI